MLTKQIITIVVAILILSASVSAQGEFLAIGESGVFACYSHNFSEKAMDVESARLTPNSPYAQENWESASLLAGISINGTADLTFAYRKRDYHDIRQYRLTITYYMKKKTSWGFAGAGLIGGYARSEADTSTFFSTLFQDRKDLVLGVKIFTDLNVGNFLLWQLALSGHLLTTLEERYDGTIMELAGTGTLVLINTNPVRPYISAGIAVEDKGGADTYGSVKTGLVLTF